MKKTEREQLRVAIEEIEGWRNSAATTRHICQHLPLSKIAELGNDDAAMLARISSLDPLDLELAGSFAQVHWFQNRKSVRPARDAGHRVLEFHRAVVECGQAARLATIQEWYEIQLVRERSIVEGLVKAIGDCVPDAQDALFDHAHMPTGTSHTVTAEDIDFLKEIVRTANQYVASAGALLNEDHCVIGECERNHTAASALSSFHHTLMSFGGIAMVHTIRGQLREKNQEARETVRTSTLDLTDWAEAAQESLHVADHMPLTDSSPLSNDEAELLTSLVLLTADHLEIASALAERSTCEGGGCTPAHDAWSVLTELHTRASVPGNVGLARTIRANLLASVKAERRTVSAAAKDIKRWASRAKRITDEIGHMAPGEPHPIDDSTRAALAAIVFADETHRVSAQQLKNFQRCEAGDCQTVHVSARTLVSAHEEVSRLGGDPFIRELAATVDSKFREGRKHLKGAIAAVDAAVELCAAVFTDVEHMPLSRSGVVDDQTISALQALTAAHDEYRSGAQAISTGDLCAEGTCAMAHEAALHLTSTSGSIDLVALRALAQDVKSRYSREREAVEDLFGSISSSQSTRREVMVGRRTAKGALEECVPDVFARSTTLNIDKQSWQLVPIMPADHELLALLWYLRDTVPVQAALPLVKRAAEFSATRVFPLHPTFDKHWNCTRDERCSHAHSQLPDVYNDGLELQAELDAALRPTRSVPNLNDLLDPSIGLLTYLPEGSTPVELLDAPELNAMASPLALIANTADAEKQGASDAKAAAEVVREADVAAALKQMDLDVLRSASNERIRTGALQDAGMTSVWDVLKFDEKYYLEYLPGIGWSSAQSIMQAALRLLSGVREETPVRIDVRRKLKRTLSMLEKLHEWDLLRDFDPNPDDIALAKALVAIAGSAPDLSHLLVIRPHELPSGASSESERMQIASFSARLTEAVRRAPAPREDSAAPADIWQDFLARPSAYFGLLTELGFVTEDEARMHGDLPQEIIDAVRAKDLNRTHLTASLRAYQSFGARFALVQKQVIIGDEMGLGKTVEALAAIAHLRATGHVHFLVLCPAAVISNWTREVAKHTTLKSFRLHGAPNDRESAARAWVRDGGIAVTTYDLLHWSREYIRKIDLSCAVLDEAHYIKNPEAKRSMASADVIRDAGLTIMMTGTPLENNVGEFSNLVSYIRPDLAGNAPEYLPSKFRKHVAPAYLRRNQEDVLQELPDLIEVDDWTSFSRADAVLYRDAVEASNFMHMRRAAMLSPTSTKLERLIEIVGEAEDNNRRVIVFSYFRDALARIAEALPGRVFGPLTGSVPAAKRQALVDDFAAAAGGAALVAQITAGGVGLNIQSASVVVICEPQLKPTLEAQAIARAHRMGQTQSVQVHRLLTENSVDERIREILAHKRELFDAFARDSVIAKNAPDAVDISDAELARVVIAAERERLFGVTHPTPRL